MQKALELKKEAEDDDLSHIPCERTVCRTMEQLGIVHTPKHKPNRITKADREGMKSDDKIKMILTKLNDMLIV